MEAEPLSLAQQVDELYERTDAAYFALFHRLAALALSESEEVMVQSIYYE